MLLTSFKRITFTLILLASLVGSSHASTITINSGSSILVSGGDLILDCSDIEVVVNSDGELRITSGSIKDLNIRVMPNGSYTRTGGEVTDCDGFYVIQTANGTLILNL